MDGCVYSSMIIRTILSRFLTQPPLFVLYYGRREMIALPELSRFDGISVYMYSEPNSPHKLPHIHAVYQGQEVVVSLDGNILEGDLPSKKPRTLLVWMDMRQKELEENWSLLSQGKRFFKVEPLR